MQFKKEQYTVTDFQLVLESKRKTAMSISKTYMILVKMRLYSTGSERAVLKSGSQNKFSKRLGVPVVYKQSQFHYNLELNSKSSHTILNYWLT